MYIRIENLVNSCSGPIVREDLDTIQANPHWISPIVFQVETELSASWKNWDLAASSIV